MNIHSKTLAIVIVIVMFGGILISNYAGWWLTESTKVVSTISEGEFAGLPDPQDIRGSYTLGDVESNFGIPTEELADAFRIAAEDPAAFAIKDLETQYEDSDVEIGTASVRLFVAMYAGLPLDLSLEESYLPGPAVKILRDKPLTDEQAAYLDTHTVELSGLIDQTNLADTVDELHDETETTIKGKTTFAEVLSWGVSAERIEQIMGIPLPEEKLSIIKDYITENGLDFETIKESLQISLDELD